MATNYALAWKSYLRNRQEEDERKKREAEERKRNRSENTNNAEPVRGGLDRKSSQKILQGATQGATTAVSSTPALQQYMDILNRNRVTTRRLLNDNPAQAVAQRVAQQVASQQAARKTQVPTAKPALTPYKTQDPVSAQALAAKNPQLPQFNYDRAPTFYGQMQRNVQNWATARSAGEGLESRKSVLDTATIEKRKQGYEDTAKKSKSYLKQKLTDLFRDIPGLRQKYDLENKSVDEFDIDEIYNSYLGRKEAREALPDFPWQDIDRVYNQYAESKARSANADRDLVWSRVYEAPEQYIKDAKGQSDYEDVIKGYDGLVPQRMQYVDRHGVVDNNADALDFLANLDYFTKPNMGDTAENLDTMGGSKKTEARDIIDKATEEARGLVEDHLGQESRMLNIGTASIDDLIVYLQEHGDGSKATRDLTQKLYELRDTSLEEAGALREGTDDRYKYISSDELNSMRYFASKAIEAENRAEAAREDGLITEQRAAEYEAQLAWQKLSSLKTAAMQKANLRFTEAAREDWEWWAENNPVKAWGNDVLNRVESAAMSPFAAMAADTLGNAAVFAPVFESTYRNQVQEKVIRNKIDNWANNSSIGASFNDGIGKTLGISAGDVSNFFYDGINSFVDQTFRDLPAVMGVPGWQAFSLSVMGSGAFTQTLFSDLMAGRDKDSSLKHAFFVGSKEIMTEMIGADAATRWVNGSTFLSYLGKTIPPEMIEEGVGELAENAYNRSVNDYHDEARQGALSRLESGEVGTYAAGLEAERRQEDINPWIAAAGAILPTALSSGMGYGAHRSVYRYGKLSEARDVGQQNVDDFGRYAAKETEKTQLNEYERELLDEQRRRSGSLEDRKADMAEVMEREAGGKQTEQEETASPGPRLSPEELRAQQIEEGQQEERSTAPRRTAEQVQAANEEDTTQQYPERETKETAPGPQQTVDQRKAANVEEGQKEPAPAAPRRTQEQMREGNVEETTNQTPPAQQAEKQTPPGPQKKIDERKQENVEDGKQPQSEKPKRKQPPTLAELQAENAEKWQKQRAEEQRQKENEARRKEIEEEQKRKDSVRKKVASMTDEEIAAELNDIPRRRAEIEAELARRKDVINKRGKTIEKLVKTATGAKVKAATAEEMLGETKQDSAVSTGDLGDGKTIKGLDIDGNIMASDGSTISAKDVDWDAMPATKEVYDTAMELSEDYNVAPGVVFAAYADGMRASVFRSGARAIVSAARAGTSLQSVLSNHRAAAALDPRMVQAMYDQAAEKGVQFARERTEVAAKLKPLESGEGNVSMTPEAAEFLKGLKPDNTILQSVQVINDLFGKHGPKIQFFLAGEGAEQGAINKAADTIRVALDAGDKGGMVQSAVLQVLPHELTHMIATRYVDGYVKLQRYISDYLTSQGKSLDDYVEDIRAEYKAAGVDLTAEQATEEAIAKASELVLKDSKFAERVANNNPSLANRIVDWLRSMKARIANIFKNYKPLSAIARDMQDAMDGYVKIWDDALEQALNIKREQAQNIETVKGDDGTAYTASNEEIGFHYELVDAFGLTASNDYETMLENPLYPSELQPRDRSRQTSEDQIDSIMRDLNPNRLMGSSEVSTGAPIVGPDYIVESGNGRTIALQRVMKQGGKNAQKYTEALRQRAAEYGFKPEDVKDGRVLVRVRDSAMNNAQRAEFAKASNVSATMTSAAAETATSDAQKLSSKTLDKYNPDGDVQSNADFYFRFLNEAIPASDRNSMLTRTGQPSQALIARAKAAMFYRAYGNNDLTAHMSEQADPEAKNTVNAMMNVAARVASISDQIKDGTLHDINFAGDIAAAAEQYVELKRTGQDVNDWLNQSSMFEQDDTVRDIVGLMEKYKRSAVKLTGAFNSILDQVEAAGNPEQESLFGNDTLPTKQEIVQRAGNEEGTRYSLKDLERIGDGVNTFYDDFDRHSLRVTDPGELEMLNSGKTITTYKTMKLIDGKLYPPKATLAGRGSMEDYSILGKWEKAVEHPEWIKFKDGKPTFDLVENGSKTTNARYNPYMHSSNLMINDQFSGAYQYGDDKSNLGRFVTVECEVPASEETSGYHAQYAKDGTGWHSWHAGTVAGQLHNQKNIERQVFLSRWIKPVRIVPDSEVAAHYAELLKRTNIEVPDNVVPPSLLAALREAGVPIKETGKVKGGDTRFSLRSSDADYMAAVEHGDMETAQRMVDEAAKAAGYNTTKLYHGTRTFGFTKFDLDMGEQLIFATGSRDLAQTYSGKTARSRISERVTKDPDILHGEELISEVKKVLPKYNGYKLATKAERKQYIDDSRNRIDRIIQQVNDFVSENDGAFDRQKSDIINGMIGALQDLAAAVNSDEVSEAWDKYENAAWDLKWMDESIQMEIAEYTGRELMAAKNTLDDFLYDGDLYIQSKGLTDAYVFDNQLQVELGAEWGKGVYELYGKPGKQLVIEANGENWNSIKPPEELSTLFGPQRTRDIAAAAKAADYSSVLIKDLRDSGGETDYNRPSDVYIFLKPNQVKSSDPVTHDDAGNVIPLSERFNPEKEDIRYSLKDVDNENDDEYNNRGGGNNARIQKYDTGRRGGTGKDNARVWRSNATSFYAEAAVYFDRGDYAGLISRRDSGYAAFSRNVSGTAIVAKDGTPLILYHGTRASFDTFSDKTKHNYPSSVGFYFTDSARVAKMYGDESKLSKGRSAIHPVALVAKSPVTFNASDFGNNYEVQNNALKYIKSYRKYAGQKGFINNLTRALYRNQYISDKVARKIIDAFSKNGDIDSVIVKDCTWDYNSGIKNNQYIVFTPDQVVPATSEYWEKQSGSRYSLRGESELTDREVLGEAMKEIAKTGGDQLYLDRYQQAYNELTGFQKDLEKQQKIMASSASNTDEYRAASNRAAIYQEKIGRAEEKLEGMESDPRFAAMVRAERERAEAAVARDYESGSPVEQEREELIRGYERKLRDRRRALDKYREDRNTSADRSRYIERITDTAKGLSELLYTNTDKKHVPEALKKPLGDFLNALNLYSKRYNEGGSKTQKDLKLSQYLRRVQDAARRTEGINEAGDYTGELYLPQGFVDQIADLAQTIENLEQAYKDADPVVHMNNDSLKRLDQTLRALKKAISDVNKLYTNAAYQKVSDMGRASIHYLNGFTPMSKRNGKFKRYLNWDMATPVYAMDRFGKVGQSLFKAIRDGYGQRAQRLNEIEEYAAEHWTAKEAKAWKEDIKTFTFDRVTDDGEHAPIEMKLTVSQIMELYLATKRDQAMKHIEVGGIRARTITEGSKTLINQPEAAHLGLDEIKEITGSLTDRQREVCDAMSKYMRTTSAWGNEVSMRRFGYNAFGEANYWPISTDEFSRDGVPEQGQTQGSNLYRLLNMTFTKAVNPHANNALLLNGAFETFAAHTTDMATYSTMALPALDMIKWYNFREKLDDGTLISTRGSMSRTYGDEAAKYIRNLISDFSGSTRTVERGTENQIYSKLMSHAKRAAVAGNLSVVLKQPGSILRAGYVLPRAMYLRPSALISRHDYNEMLEHSGIARWKSMGYFDTNLAKPMEAKIAGDETWSDKVVEFMTKGAEWADKNTMVSIWKAAKVQVAHDNKGMDRGSEEYFQKVADLFEDIIYRTQVVDSSLTRSQSMRNPGFLGKTINAFMAEPTLSYNVMMDALTDVVEDHRQGRKGISKATGKKIAVASTTYVMTQVVQALVGAMMGAWRDDDDYKTFMEKFWERVGSSITEELNPINSIPLVSFLLDSLNGDNSSVADSGLVQLRYAYKGFEKVFWKDGKFNENWQEDMANDWQKLTRYSLSAASYLSGLPGMNVGREVWNVWNNAMDLTGNQELKFHPYSSSDSNKSIAAMLYDAVRSGDQAKVGKLQKAMAANGTTEKVMGQFDDVVKEDLLAGNIGVDDAERLLIDYAGFDRVGTKSAYYKIQEWLWKAEGGHEYNFGITARAKEALASGDASEIDAAYRELTEKYGKTDKDARSTMGECITELYKNKIINRRTAELLYRKYTDRTDKSIQQSLDRYE